MADHRSRARKVLKTLADGTSAVRKNPSESEYQRWVDKLDRAGKGVAIWPWLLVGIGILAGCVFLFALSGRGTETSTNEPSLPTITLNNQSSQTVCYVYISPVTDEYWGNDWLGASEVIRPGGSRLFKVDAGRYDLRAEDCERSALSVQWDVNIETGHHYTWSTR